MIYCTIVKVEFIVLSFHQLRNRTVFYATPTTVHKGSIQGHLWTLRYRLSNSTLQTPKYKLSLDFNLLCSCHIIGYIHSINCNNCLSNVSSNTFSEAIILIVFNNLTSHFIEATGVTNSSFKNLTLFYFS